MGLKNIVHPEEIFVEEYVYEFESCDYSQWYTFDCDADGVVVITDDNRANYEYCLKNSGTTITDCGIHDRSRWIRKASYGTCDCGRIVRLRGDYGNGIDCDCGRIYNMSGQELAPRSQWDEYMNDGDRYMVSEMNGGYDDY